MRKTPIERAISEQTDRRARYERSQREAGLVRASLYVHLDVLDSVKAVCRATAVNPDLRDALKSFADEMKTL